MGQIFSSSSSIKTNNNSQEQHKKIKPNNNSQKPYDVFLSFRGEDTRYGITSHIYTALAVEKKIETYIDEKSLERGDEISPALLGAIERSKIAVIVFSEHYATSSWCLSELVHIDKCRRNLGQIVVPIFYKVDPSNVRAQYEGSYKDAFKKHEKSSKHKSETIKEWRAALEAIGSISGLHYKQSDNGPESALVKEVVETILKKLGRPVVSDVDFKGLIGMNDHFTKLESLLSDSSSKLQILGIWGMPGIGKTTIANAVFSQLSSRFESFYFLTNVRERSEKHGLERLRDELIAELLGDKNTNFGILSSSIPEYAKERLRRTKVLLVLDDVSKWKQLEHLVGNHFGSESRIIVTTRDEGVLRGTNIEADFKKYKVNQLSFKKSLELFNLKTFGGSSSLPEYEDLPSKVVRCLGGNPLAITVFGSHLCSLRNPSKENWEMELKKLKDVSLDDIQNVLRISYNGLDETQKKIFLDIACFFKGEKRRFVENILDGCNFYASTGIDKLIDKSLVTEICNWLHMHDLVQQMGWLIVREESEELCKRSRIWIAEEARRVFEEDIVNFQGTCQIEGIFLDTSELDEDVHLKPAVFQRMYNLRLLKINDESYFNFYSRDTMKHKVYIEELDDYFPRSLTYLEWKGYPLKSLPSKFNPRNLVELKMPCSQVETLWHGIKNLDKLTCIDLNHSTNLTQIPNLSRVKNLETLNLESCTSLVKVPWDSLRNLSKLLDLNLGGCHKIGDFPDRIDLGVLKTLNLSGCVNLKTVPAIVSRSLASLKLDSTNIVSVPSSIGSSSSLKKLSFNECRLLKKLPCSIAQLNCLEDLSLDYCSSLEMFPVLPSNIKKLSMSQAVIKEVPSSCFEHCSYLYSLYITNCKELESLPSNIFGSGSSHLEYLGLDGCSNLKNLPEIPNLAKSKLEELSLSKSGIRNLPLSIGKLTNLTRLIMVFCENLEFVDNLSTSGLKRLEIMNCKKLQRISQLPLSLESLDAAECTSLEIVTDSRLNEFRNRFWDNSPERLKLEQSLIDFQLRVLHRAIRRNELETNYPINTVYSGDKIPEWFNHRSNNDSPNSITIPLASEWPCPDFLGFALCAVVSCKSCSSLCIDCKIKFQTEDQVEFWSMPIPYLESDQVVMWYPYRKDKMYPDTAGEVTFEFLIMTFPDTPDFGEIKACGVHMLCWSDLPELVEHETEESLVEIADVAPKDSVDETRDRKRKKENVDEISSSLVKRQRF